MSGIRCWNRRLFPVHKVVDGRKKWGQTISVYNNTFNQKLADSDICADARSPKPAGNPSVQKSIPKMMRTRLSTSEHHHDESSDTLKYVGLPLCVPSGSSRIEESTAEISITEENNVKINCNNSCLCKTQGHNRQLNDLLQDDLQENAATKESSESYHELLMSAIGSIDELKGDISTLKHLNAGLTKSVESYKDNMDQLKTENNVLKTQITELNNKIQSHKPQALKSESDILELRSMVITHKVQAKMTEASYYMRKLTNLLERRNINLPESVQRNCEEFYNYIRKCIAILANLEVTYQRLRNRLQQGYSINMSELELNLPALPRLYDEVSQYIGRRFEANNRFEVPSHWFFEAPPPYSRYPADNEVSHNRAQVPSQRETEAPLRSECEVTLASDLQAPLSGSTSLVSRSESQVQLNRHSLTLTDNELQTLSGSDLQASLRISESHGASGNIYSGSEFNASSVSEHYASPRNESHASSGREFHASSGSEPYNSTRSELPSTNGFCTSQGYATPQIPPSSMQSHYNGLHQVPQIIMSTPLTGTMSELHSNQQVLRPQSCVQYLQQHSRMMPAQAHGTVHFPVYTQPMRAINNWPQGRPGQVVMQNVLVSMNPSEPVYPYQNPRTL